MATTSGPLVLLFLLAAVLVVAATVAFALMRARPVLVGTAPPADAGAGVLLGQGLTRSRQALGERIAAIGTRSRLDDEAWEAVEDALIRADVGARATGALLEKLRRQKLTPESVGEALRRQLGVILDRPDRTLQVVKGAASVWLVAGFNGTAHATAGKLAKLLEDQGRRVVVTEAGEHDHAGGAAGTLTDTVANAHGEGIDVVVVDAGGSQDPSAGIAEL